MNIRIPKQLSVLSHLTYGKRVRPARDWLALLIASFVLLTLGALVATWMFFKEPEVNPEAVTPIPANTVSEHMLEETNALFEARSREEARYRSEYRFVDPSL